jgi:hypothetical protein
MQRHPVNKIRRGPKLKKNGPGRIAFTAMILIPAVCGLFNPGLHAQSPPAVQESDQAEISRAVTVVLYFADKDRFALLAEQRELTRPKSPDALGRIIIRELTTGPRNKNLVRTLPANDILRAFFIAADKTAYVDLGNEMWARHPGGVQSDILAIYSIVNSLVLNMAEIDAVKVLILGREPIMATGHLDLRYPLKANILLIR